LLAVAWPKFRRSQSGAFGLLPSGAASGRGGPPPESDPRPPREDYAWIDSFAIPAFVIGQAAPGTPWVVRACSFKAAQALRREAAQLVGEDLSALWRTVPGWPQTALHALIERHAAHAQEAAQTIARRTGERWEVRYQALGAQAQRGVLVTLWPVADPHGDNTDDHQAFSYAVSHDLRAPLRVVEGFSRIIKEDYGHQLDRVCNDHLDRVMSAATRMNAMIDALLAQAQLSSRPLSRQAVDLSELAHFVLDDLRRQHPERQVECVVQPDLQVTGDPTLLRMMMDNLLGNAWKYSAHATQARVEFGREPGPGGRYFVRDNGVGFDMRFADRLFGLFQRLHSASDYPGTGLGLASVRRIVHRHGGEITAESVVGQGSSFYFTLGED
jgi:signal transduction histidine kinase